MHSTRYLASFLRQTASPVCKLAVAICAVSLTGQAVSAAEPDRTPTLSLALDDLEKHLIQPEWLDALPPATILGVERLVAFEDHAHFIFVSGATGINKSHDAAAPGLHEPEILRRVIFIRPGIVVIDDQIAPQGAGEVAWRLTAPDVLTSNRRELFAFAEHVHYRVRSVLPEAAAWRVSRSSEQQGLASHTLLPPQDATSDRMRVLHVLSRSKHKEAPAPTRSLRRDALGLQLELTEQAESGSPGRVIRLWIPNGSASAKLQILDRNGMERVPKRLLPAGILPPGLEAAQRRLQWDLAYRLEGKATWDTNQPSSQLRRLVESGQIKPGRTVEIGCGTGNDAIYLASRGFDVTAIDISPTALKVAEEKAAEAGVNVQWLLADVLQPPLVTSFDFIYDRGCYHEIRRHHAEAYVAAVRELSHNGSKVLILAGSANKDSYWSFHGPPRVKEKDIRKDFAAGFRVLGLSEFRFDPVPPENEGALAWSILLRRDEQNGRVEVE